MAKKTKKVRRRFAFTVAPVFPPDDALAINLLRLMTAHNDLSFLSEWMVAHFHIPRTRAAQSIAASRFFFLQRVFSAIMVEALKVLSDVERLPGFPELVRELDQEGREALATLRKVPPEHRNPVYRVLHRTRNKAAFHYDPGQFEASLRALIKRYGTDAESHFIFVPAPGGAEERGRVYYALADQLATEVSFGLPAAGSAPLPHEAFQTAIDLHSALTQFIESLFAAYARRRGFENIFREEPSE